MQVPLLGDGPGIWKWAVRTRGANILVDTLLIVTASSMLSLAYIDKSLNRDR